MTRGRASASRGELDRAQDVESRPEHVLEVVSCVVRVRALVLPSEQALDHDVLAVGKLDDQLAADVGEPADELAQRDRSPDHEMVDQREGKDQVRPAALQERQSLLPTPAEAG